MRFKDCESEGGSRTLFTLDATGDCFVAADATVDELRSLVEMLAHDYWRVFMAKPGTGVQSGDQLMTIKTTKPQ